MARRRLEPDTPVLVRLKADPTRETPRASRGCSRRANHLRALRFAGFAGTAQTRSAKRVAVRRHLRSPSLFSSLFSQRRPLVCQLVGEQRSRTNFRRPGGRRLAVIRVCCDSISAKTFANGVSVFVSKRVDTNARAAARGRHPSSPAETPYQRAYPASSRGGSPPPRDAIRRDHGEAAVPVPGDGDGEGRGGRPAKRPSRAADPPLEPAVARAFLEKPPLARAKPPASSPADVGVDGVADPRKTRDP